MDATAPVAMLPAGCTDVGPKSVFSLGRPLIDVDLRPIGSPLWGLSGRWPPRRRIGRDKTDVEKRSI
jgi:hypothetical protein